MSMATPAENARALLARAEALAAKIADPAAMQDRRAYAALQREYTSLLPLSETAQAILHAEDSIAQAKALLQDAELGALAREEEAAARARLESLWQTLRAQLCAAAQDEDDGRAVVMEIRAGAGGEEAALFAADLYRMYCMYAARRGFSTELVEKNETELGGLRQVCFTVNGAGVYARLKYESGVHRVQRVPRTESQGRIQTSTATVAVLPQAEEIEVALNPKDLKIESCKSSGAGGQHINKTESAVRITHLPSGIVVECQDERSQFKNKDKALRILRAKLYEKKKTERQQSIDSARRAQLGTGDRSERIRTYNFPQGRVSDHRIKLTLHNIDAFLGGDMDGLIEPLIAADMAKRSEQDRAFPAEGAKE